MMSCGFYVEAGQQMSRMDQVIHIMHEKRPADHAGGVWAEEVHLTRF